MAFKRYNQKTRTWGIEVYAILPHRPVSADVVKAATDRYVQEEKDGKLDSHRPSGKHWE